VRRLPLCFSFLFLSLVSLAVTVAEQESPPSNFPPLEQWRLAVADGNAKALYKMFENSPSLQIKGPNGKNIPVRDEVNFWTGWKAQGLAEVHVEIVQEKTQVSPQPDLHLQITRGPPTISLVVVVQVIPSVNTNSSPKKYYVGMAQVWVNAGNGWQLAAEQRQDATRLKQPMEQKDLYPASSDAKSEIAEAIHSATAARKRILVVFGANWCYDCHVLEEAFHSPEISPTMESSFEVVHVDIGKMDKNLDVAKQFDVPLDRGVPALAVLESDGKLLFSQKRGEFEAARSMAPEDILDFLNKWKPATRKN
jgi:hypothetical protein